MGARKKDSHKKEKARRRGIWQGSLSFGLVNIPISLESAQEKEKIHFRMLDKKDHSPIGYKTINKRTGDEIPRSQIVKAYEHQKGEFIVITAKDFEKANVKATSTIDIEDFVSLDEVDPMLFEKPYYVVPRKGGEKGYALLREVLKDTNKAAIAKVVLHTVQHLVAVIPREDFLILEILRFADEIKEIDEIEFAEEKPRSRVSEREIKIAKQLVEGMTSKWKPDKYKNTYREDLMKMINIKVKKGDIEQVPEIETPTAESSNLIDLTNLLKKSLNATRKSSAKKKSG